MVDPEGARRRQFEKLFHTLNQIDTTTAGVDTSARVVLTLMDNEEQVKRVWEEVQKGRKKGIRVDGEVMDDMTVKIRKSLVADVKCLWDLSRPDLLHYWDVAEANLEESNIDLVPFLWEIKCAVRAFDPIFWNLGY